MIGRCNDEITLRVMRRLDSDYDILPEHRAREVSRQGVVARSCAVALHAELIVSDKIVCESKSISRRPVCGDDVSGLNDGVVIDRHSVAFGDLQESAITSPACAADVFEQIVVDADAARLSSRLIRCAPLNLYSRSAVPQEVVPEPNL